MPSLQLISVLWEISLLVMLSLLNSHFLVFGETIWMRESSSAMSSTEKLKITPILIFEMDVGLELKLLAKTA